MWTLAQVHQAITLAIVIRKVQWHWSEGIFTKKCLNHPSLKLTRKNTSLTHWGRVAHICVGEIIIIGSNNGLSPDRRQAIIWTNAGLLSIEPLRTYFSENLIKIQPFSLKKMHMKMSSAKWRPSCLGLNVLKSPRYQRVKPWWCCLFQRWLSMSEMVALCVPSCCPASTTSQSWCLELRWFYSNHIIQGWFYTCAQPLTDVVTK